MFLERLTAASQATDAFLHREIAAMGNLPVIQAMGYAVGGGKGLRGFFVVEGARLHAVDEEQAILAAAAVEAVHAYSLIHDDLPCMDDDDLRRGQPTVHVKWDDATAVLAGDGLQALAFDLLARVTPSDRAVALSGSLARAAGAPGMVGGQALDIAAETAEAALTLEQITELQARKTGALIEWSGAAGAHLAGADPEPLRQYARRVGLAFQIADDILDVEGDADAAGKRLQKDAGANKATFVSLMGLEPARAKALALAEEAADGLAPYGASADVLREAARYVVTRDR